MGLGAAICQEEIALFSVFGTLGNHGDAETRSHADDGFHDRRAQVAVLAVLLASLIAIPAGMLAAWRQNSRIDVGTVSIGVQTGL